MTMKDIFNDILSPAGGAEVSIIPVMQGEGLMKVNESDLPDSLPILALRNAVLFPGSVFPITIGRDKSIRLIEDAEDFRLYMGQIGYASFIHSGDFQIPMGASYEEIANILIRK